MYPLVMPRRLTCVCPTPLLVKFRLGTVLAKSRNSVAPSVCNSCPVSAVMDIGTSRMRSSIFWAVTITSSGTIRTSVSSSPAAACARPIAGVGSDSDDPVCLDDSGGGITM